ncbi:MAG: OmpH family outer membrane protein [Bacteroidota bacterium]|nr:OmpH family outer membrane protein [Bacteroidota bacterium]MDP4212241.1 OmpH family outer membrane protein [Bacteroidota bacterium]MDP4251357.1 OmpH family outer membrane protein [Bacteroidota bacterium]
MKKIVAVILVATTCMFAGSPLHAQMKMGYIDVNELIREMPEFKKADTSLADFQSALNQNFDDMKREFSEKDSLLSSKDTVKYTKAQIEIKRRQLGELYLKIQGYQQQAGQQYQQKQQDLLGPVQKKAQEVVQQVAKENGYTYVFLKDALLVSPPAEDLLPIVKKKLGLK